MELYRFETRDVVLEVKSGSQTVAPDATPTATLTSELPTVINRSLVVTTLATGVYSVPLTIADTGIPRELKVTWSYTIGGVVVSHPTYITVSTAYSELAALRNVAPAGTPDDELREASAFAKTVIDAVCSQEFDMHYRDYSVNGTGKDIVTLPDRIISIDKITNGTETVYENGVVGEITITPTKHGVRLWPVQDDYSSLEISTWADGTTYLFEGWFGWEYVPLAVQQAHKLLVNDWFCGDSKWKKRYISEQSSADWTVKFDSRVFTETGNYYADKLLSDYIRAPLAVF